MQTHNKESKFTSLQIVYFLTNCLLSYKELSAFLIAQMVEHGASNAKIMGSIPRESKSW